MQSQLMYDAETGLSGSDLIQIACKQDSPFETSWRGDGRAGNLAFQQINVREGLDIWRFEHSLSRQVNISSSKNDQSMLAFRFYLQGTAHHYEIEEKKQLTMKAGLQDIFYSPCTNNISIVPADTPGDMVGIYISFERLSSWMVDDNGLASARLRSILTGRDEELFWHSRAMTRAMRHTLNRMILCPLTGMTRRLFIESCALELICLQLESFRDEVEHGTKPDRWCFHLHPDAVRKIRRVQDRINDAPGEVPCLDELAREADMSQSTLSRLFKKACGMTVFEYVRNARLDLAARRLAQGMTVTEVAFDVGYDNMSHFSKAFKERFGKPPSRFTAD